MKGFLNHAQIEYVLYHLGQQIHLRENLKDSFVFVKADEKIAGYKNKIVFPLSEKKLNLSDVKWIKDIPVLFPLSQEENLFYNNDGNIIFTHDLLKSAFYLLSGFQEKDHGKLDLMGRFAYESSVQAKLNIIQKPVTNYYFEEIITGIKEYCNLNNIEFPGKTIFNTFTFFLTHDVDRVKYYNFNSLLYTIKLLFRFNKEGKSSIGLVKEIFRIGFHILNFFNNKDPYWNFKDLSGKEKELGICSTYFFLPKDQKHVDSYYNIDQKEISGLIEFLRKEGNEIGLHGTVRSSSSLESLKKILSDFLGVTNQTQTGIRQHRLMWQHPLTARIHDVAGISYDSTLGFADHEGFRNSYCHPFKIFDFENNRMLSYWEIPLNVMDSSLFHYQKLSIDDATKSIMTILEEIKRFNGVFTLLWHNSYFNESEIPGITNFYHDLLNLIIAEKPEISTGLKIVARYKDICKDE